jgi:hypothetical protein
MENKGIASMKLLTCILIIAWAATRSADAAESPAELVLRWSFEDNLEDSSGNEYFGKKTAGNLERQSILMIRLPLLALH